MNRSPFSAPADQASGLRRLFGVAGDAGPPALLALAANPFVPASALMLGTLADALLALGRQVLVVDAASTAPAPQDAARIDLAAAVETMHHRLHYIAARGLPLAYVDNRGSAATLIDALQDAVPQADTVLLHADPAELARLIHGRSLRPLLLAADHPDALKQAYAGCKLLVQRSGLMVYDLLISADAGNRRVPLIADNLASCADGFLGALLHEWAAIDPLADPHAAHDQALQRLLAAHVHAQTHALTRAPLAVSPSAFSWPARSVAGATHSR